MKKLKLNKIKTILRHYPEIKLAYFFGSKATGKSGPLSDYDFAFYVDEKDKEGNRLARARGAAACY